MTDNARDVIARATLGVLWGLHDYADGLPQDWQESIAKSIQTTREEADAIITALNAAGFEIVKRGEYIPIKIDPTMPENEIEVRSDVDSVRLSDLAISHQIRWALQKAKLEQEKALLHPPKRDPADEPEGHYNYYLKDDYPSVL